MKIFWILRKVKTQSIHSQALPVCSRQGHDTYQSVTEFPLVANSTAASPPAKTQTNFHQSKSMAAIQSTGSVTTLGWNNSYKKDTSPSELKPDVKNKVAKSVAFHKGNHLYAYTNTST